MSRSIPLLLLAYLVLTTQVDFGTHLAWHDQQRAGQLLLLVAMPGMALLSGMPRRAPAGPGFTWANACLAAVALLGAWSAARSLHPRWAFLDWSLLVSLALGVALLATSRRTGGERYDRALLWTFGAVSGLLCAQALLVYGLVSAAGEHVGTVELSGLAFSNRRFLGQFLTIAIPVVGAAALHAASRKEKRLWHFVLVASWTLAFVSATRGTFFALVVAGTITAVILRQHAGPFLVYQAKAALVGLLAYLVLFAALPWIASLPVTLESRIGNASSSSGRLLLWQFVAGLAASHPGLGIGPMGLASAIHPAVPVAHPHNAVLQVAAEWGLPALLLVTASFALILRAVVRTVASRTPVEPLDVALLLACMAWVTHSLVDGVIVMPVTQVAAMVATGWLLGRIEAVPELPIVTVRIRWIAIGMLACALGTAWLARPELTRALTGEPPVSLGNPSGAYPRFWQRGWVGHPLGAHQPEPPGPPKD